MNAALSQPAASSETHVPNLPSSLAEIELALRRRRLSAAAELTVSALDDQFGLRQIAKVYAKAQRLDLLIPLIWERRETVLRQLPAISVFLEMCLSELPHPVYSRIWPVWIWRRARRKLSTIAGSMGIFHGPRRGDFYRRELRAWVLSDATPPITFSHMAIVRQFSSLESTNTQRLRELILFKYSGWDNSSPENLAKSIAALAGRFKIPQNLLEFLYQRRTDQQLDFPTWLGQVKSAQALIHLFKDASLAKLLIEGAPANERNFLKQLRESAHPKHHVDLARAQLFFEELGSPRGILLSTFHGGFSNVLNGLYRRFMRDHYAVKLEPRGAESQEMVVRHGARGAAFRALKTLMEKKTVLIGPDGPLFGDASAVDITVLGRTARISVGGARIAYEAGSDTGWCSVTRKDGLFVPFYVPGPRREVGETFEQFRDRWAAFYSAQVETALCSDPRSLALVSHLWSSLAEDRAIHVENIGPA